MKPDFTLILACYNESPHIYKNISEIITMLELSRYSYEIILIDDKSQDNTAQKIGEIVKKYKYCKAIFHKANVGRGGTVMEGIFNASSDIVGYIDIDLEVRSDYILRFVNIIKRREADLVVGQRIEQFLIFPLDIFLRIVLSKVYAYIVKLMLNLPVNDTEAGYKFFYRPKILPILDNIQSKHWFWDTEIIDQSFTKKLKIKEIPVLFIKNPAKKSTVRLIPDIISYIKSLYQYKTKQVK